MQATKGILAALGAATSLLAAGALALFTVSLIVAFQGWPDISGAPASRGVQVALHDPLRDVSRGNHRARIVIQAGPVRVHHEVNHGQVGPATLAARSHAGPRATTPVLTASSGHAEPVVSHPVHAPAPVHAPVTLKPTTDKLGTAVTDGTQQLGETLRPASPALANTVEKVGGVLGQTVTNVGNLVNNVLSTLLTGQQAPY